MSYRFAASFSLAFLALVSFVVTGCESKMTKSGSSATTVAQSGGDDHDHDHDHDHGEHEGHDHGEHEGHDHGEHEGHDHAQHEGHDHAQHGDHEHDEHEGHDHSEHEGHDHGFDSLAPALKELESISAHVGEAFTSGKPEDAHQDLHHVGDVLGAMEKLVKEKFEGDQQTKAAAAVENLFDSFIAIDDTLHGKKGKDYSEVQDDIAGAIATLKELAQ